jgi:hypothetical protein
VFKELSSIKLRQPGLVLAGRIFFFSYLFPLYLAPPVPRRLRHSAPTDRRGAASVIAADLQLPATRTPSILSVQTIPSNFYPSLRICTPTDEAVAWITPPVSPLAVYWSGITEAYHLMSKKVGEGEEGGRGGCPREVEDRRRRAGRLRRLPVQTMVMQASSCSCPRGWASAPRTAVASSPRAGC